MFALLGILGGLVFIVADIPYIRDILRGKTKPHRVSWFLFFILNATNVANQAASGATNSLWLPIAATIITFGIFVLSIKRGMGGFAKLDILCLVGALTGLLLWAVLKTPLASLLCNLAVATIAVIPTIKKAYSRPDTETHITYLIASISGIIAAISVGSWNYRLLLLPFHDFLIQFIIYLVLITRSKKVGLLHR
ncbi:MAG: hypothetical protein JWS12_292 [Candidatus Saccharibacteria bacterium]|nr:hypothetical protein [Candidatus Saccharibacteria bacterium]